MDQFIPASRGRKALLFALLVLLQSAVLLNPGLAQQLDWSFAEHPHPTFDELTSAEFDIWKRGLTDPGLASNCRATLANAFAIYEGRYPDFARTGEVDRRYRAFKAHIARNPPDGIGICIYQIPATELIVSRSVFRSADLVFCGRAIRDPETETSRYFQDLTEQLLTNAEFGHPDAFAALLSANGPAGVVHLNPDVEYFLRQSLAEASEGEPGDWDVDHLLPKLDPERIAFVDAAVARKDFGAVVKTTASCPAE